VGKSSSNSPISGDGTPRKGRVQGGRPKEIFGLDFSSRDRGGSLTSAVKGKRRRLSGTDLGGGQRGEGGGFPEKNKRVRFEKVA